MSEKTTTGLGVLAGAGVLGLLGNALLRVEPWGLGAALWIGALLLGITVLGRWRRAALTRDRAWLLPAAMLFAGAMAWRDSPVLKALDLLAVGVLLCLAALRTRSGRIDRADVTEYPFAVATGGAFATAGAVPLLFSEMSWSEIPREGWGHRATAVLRGLALALPLLLIFGGLFAAADGVFRSLVLNLFRVDVNEAAASFLVSAGCAWLVAGYLWWLFFPAEVPLPASGERPPALRLGPIEIGTVLGMLNLLFLAFVAVQIRYYFGGDALVQVTPNLTYADYARRGFFELVTVAALLLPVLLLLHWLQDERTASSRLFPLLAGLLTTLLAVVLASAFQRMRLYQGAYGLTELRVYTTAFMIWLALVAGWFAVTVLREQRERFIFGATVAGLGVVLALHVVNPDALIVRTNASRIAAGRFDVRHALALSDDAVPELVRVLPRLHSDHQRWVQSELSRRQAAGRVDWRAWSWSRGRAFRALVKARETPTDPRVGQGLAAP